MRKKSFFILQKLEDDYNLEKSLINQIIKAIEILFLSYKNGGKLMVCGNGGSAADSEHIVGELMKGFLSNRSLNFKLVNRIHKLFPNDSKEFKDNLQYAIPAISLVSQGVFISAFNNDKNSDFVYAQQVLGYSKKYDVLLCISTSGNSKNVINAAKIAKVINIPVISLTGDSGGKLKYLSNVLINVPSKLTPKIQEIHLPIYHAICLVLEEEIFGGL